MPKRLRAARVSRLLLDALHEVPSTAYDTTKDQERVLGFSALARALVTAVPLPIETTKTPLDLDAAQEIVRKIIAAFRHLIELTGINKELYRDDGTPRHESSAQRLFHAVAYSYCEAYGLDISPEIDTGTGKVDFKFSSGIDARVLVEIKLSTNGAIIPGYTKQLEIYKAAQQTRRAFYVVIDVGRMGQKMEKLTKIRNEASAKGAPLSELEFVDGLLNEPPSKVR